ncbi:MAG: hypothetical protein Q9166_003941 [cf. Caloplaca sp. 2 TL-2023]
MRKTQVAPAVPSFGNPLPVKPPALGIETKKAKKKRKRCVNQLGLTPRTDEHMSSSEEEDVDEEVKLATTIGAASTGLELEVTYKGQTSTLQSPDDIASWIEERKKRFPTAARKAKNEERQRKMKEEREEKKQALKAERLLDRQKKTLEKDKMAQEQDKQEAAAKAKLKVEKLRQKLKKEERRIAKAEAKSLKRGAPLEPDEDHTPEAKRRRGQSDPKADDAEKDAHTHMAIKTVEVTRGTQATASSLANGVNGLSTKAHVEIEAVQEAEPPNSIPDPLTPTSQPALPDLRVECGQDAEESERSIADIVTTTASASGVIAEPLSSSDLSTLSDQVSDDDDDDDTSSSGSSSSGSDSDSESPETASSQRKASQKMPPPKRGSKQEKAICRDFLRSGRCRRGRRCRWRHAMPERGQRKVEQEVPFRVERKSLHQRLVEQELEKERQEKKESDEHDHETSIDTPTMVG